MTINFYKPQNDVLKQLIETFYILKREENEANSVYLTFPSINSIVSFAPNARLVKSVNRLTAIHDHSVDLFSDLTCRFNRTILVEYEGPITEVTIYFKPLGINAFLDENLNYYTKSTSFFPFSDLKENLLRIFSENDGSKMISLLENYLFSKYKGFSHPFLPQIIESFYDDCKADKSLSEIFSTFPVSQKTIIQHFEKHICKTPSDFRKILRFRNVLAEHKNPEHRHFYDLLGSTDFFDQSHMIKDFKALTGYSPKAFFRNISQIELGKIQWMFL